MNELNLMFRLFLFLLFSSICKEDANRGKPNWEHLSDELHVLITVEDSENRAHIKLERAVEEVKKLLVPVCINQNNINFFYMFFPDHFINIQYCDYLKRSFMHINSKPKVKMNSKKDN